MQEESRGTFWGRLADPHAHLLEYVSLREAVFDGPSFEKVGSNLCPAVAR